MTNEEFIMKLKVVEDMADTQVSTLAGILIDYFNESKEIKGFKPEETK
jgi:hypothetical protein